MPDTIIVTVLKDCKLTNQQKKEVEARIERALTGKKTAKGATADVTGQEVSVCGGVGPVSACWGR